MIKNREIKKVWIIEYLYSHDKYMTKHNNDIYIEFRNNFDNEYKALSNNEVEKLRLTNLKKFRKYMNSSENHFNILIEELVNETKIIKNKITFYNQNDRFVTCNSYEVI